MSVWTLLELVADAGADCLFGKNERSKAGNHHLIRETSKNNPNLDDAFCVYGYNFRKSIYARSIPLLLQPLLLLYSSPLWYLSLRWTLPDQVGLVVYSSSVPVDAWIRICQGAMTGPHYSPDGGIAEAMDDVFLFSFLFVLVSF